MTLGPLIIAIALATAVPIIVLYIIYTLDFYGTGDFSNIALCLVWGGLMVGVAYVANTSLYDRIGDYDAMIACITTNRPAVQAVRKKHFIYLICKIGYFLPILSAIRCF